MKSNSLKVWLGVAVTALVVSGCNCSSDPCEKVAVKFTTPADGATVDTPLDVTAQLVDKNGASLKVDSSSIKTVLKGGTLPTDGTVGTNAADKATFSGVNLESSCATPPCQDLIHVELSHNPGGDKAACIAKGEITVTVNANNNPPTVACGGFPQDANHDGIINSSELAMGADLKVTANTTNTIMGGTVTVSEGSNVLATQMPTLSNFDLQIPTASVTDGVHTYTLKATKNGSATATCTIDIERTPRTSCSISSPAKTTGACGSVTVLGPKADANGTKTGFQLAVTASVNTSAATTKISVSGGATLDSGALIATNNQVATVFDLPAIGTTAYTITETSTDANGNSCTDSVDVSVDYDAPTVALTSPTMAGSPYATFDVDFAATVTDTNSNCGKVMFSTVEGTLAKYFPAVAVTGGMSVTPQQENLFGGQQTVSAVAIDAAGNVGAPTTQTVTVNATTGCSIAFTSSPLDHANAVIQSSDLDPMGNYTARVIATPNCANATLKIDITPDTATCPAAGQAQSLMTTLDGSGNGNVAFPVDNGCYIIKASIGADSVSTPFTVVKDAPAITNPAQQTPYTLLNIPTDSSSTAPGYQGTLSILATIPMGAFIDICTDSMDPALIGATPTPCPGNPSLNVLVGGANITQTTTSSFTFPDPATADVPYNIYAVLVLSGGTTLTSNPVKILVDTIAPQITAATVVGATNNILNIAGLNGATHPSVSVSISDPPANIATVRIRDMVSGNPDNSVQDFTASPTTYVLDSLTTPLEATYDFTVSVRDVAQNPTIASIPATLIDSVAPTCVISSPANNAVFNIAADASSTTNGWQLAPQVTSSADAASVDVQTSPMSALVTAASSANAWTALLTVPNATGTVGTYSVTATCTDAANNSSTATNVTGVTVDLDAPTCAFVTPTTGSTTTSFVNTTTLNVTGADGQMVTLTATNSSGTTSLTSLPVSAGVATGSESYPSGVDTVNASVSDTAGNPGTCSITNYTVSGTGCDISVTSPAPNGLGHIFATSSPFNVIAHTSCPAGKNVTVTDTGNSQVFGPVATVTVSGGSDATIPVTKVDGTYGLKVEIDDGTGIKTSVTISVTVDTVGPTFSTVSPTGANLFFVAASNVNLPNAAYIVDKAAGAPADFDVVITNLAGANNGAVEVVSSAGTVATPVTSNSIATLTIPSTLVQKTSGTFTIRAKDEAGNITILSTSTIQVDVVPPSQPTVTQSIANARTATASLSWGAVYDDDTDSASGPASFDVRWSTAIVGGSTCAQYFDTTKFFKQGDVSGTSTMLQPLPPMNTYAIIVRAHDPIGNYSACTNPTPLPNPGAQDVLANPSGTPGQNFGIQMAANGSLDGDAIDDLVVAAASSDTVYVYFGNASFGSSATCNSTTHCQAITGTAGSYFGGDVAVGDVGDTAAPDLVIGAPSFNGGQGRAFIYFGGTNPIVTASPIEIDGDPADLSYGFANVVKVIPSIDGDAIGELMITSAFGYGGQGKVFIFKGRTKAQWQALGNPVPLTAADWTIVGPTPVDQGLNWFGYPTAGVGSVGDITGDGKPDFIITDPKDDINRVYQFSGAAVAAATAPITTGDGATPDQSLKRFTGGTTFSGNNFNAFGISMKGGLNLMGGSGPDLAVGNAYGQQVTIYTDAPATGWVGPAALTIGSTNLGFGNVVNAADFDGDGAPDLLIADNSTASTLWLFFHRATSNDFDTTTGTGFRQSSLTGSDIGIGVAIGDFDGNGKIDFAAGDDANSPGKVTVWHP